jgi:hypothetical protein
MTLSSYEMFSAKSKDPEVASWPMLIQEILTVLCPPQPRGLVDARAYELKPSVDGVGSKAEVFQVRKREGRRFW